MTRTKLWHLKEEIRIISRIQLPNITTVDEGSNRTTSAVLHAVRSELNCRKPGNKMVDRQTWIWTDEDNTKIRLKRHLFHKFLASKTRENGAAPTGKEAELAVEL